MNVSYKHNPYIKILTQLPEEYKKPQEIKTEKQEKQDSKWTVSLYSRNLFWTNRDFESHKQNYQQIEPWVCPEMKQRLLLSVETAERLWSRTLEFAHLLDFPDVMLHPKNKDLCFPTTPKMATQYISEGYIPLCAGDGYRYGLLGIPGTEHCGIYVGKGYGGHYIVDRDSSKNLGQKIGVVLIESLNDMFSRGRLHITRHEQCDTILDRAEIVRRVLATAADRECMGCYRYSVANFNCQTAVNGWRDQPPPDTAWGEALLWTSLALIVVILILFVVFISLSYTSKSKTITKTKTYPGKDGTSIQETVTETVE
jgi:hypothetical protein